MCWATDRDIGAPPRPEYEEVFTGVVLKAGPGGEWYTYSAPGVEVGAPPAEQPLL